MSWSEWQRHGGGEKPAHVPDDAYVEFDQWNWGTLEPERREGRPDWPHVLMYRYKIKPKVETVIFYGHLRFAGTGIWEFSTGPANARFSMQVNDGVPQWDTLRAEPL